MNFSGKLGSDQTIWCPASGFRHASDGGLNNGGGYGFYWSASPCDVNAYYLNYGNNDYVFPSGCNDRAYGQSVRCLQE